MKISQIKILLLLIFIISACGKIKDHSNEATDQSDSSLPTLNTENDEKATASVAKLSVGSACNSKKQCAGSNAVCIPDANTPKGYCSQVDCCLDSNNEDCVACMTGSSCVFNASVGKNLCLKECTQNDDCRSSQGYVCQKLSANDEKGICAPACKNDSNCPAGSYGCGKDGICVVPKSCKAVDTVCDTGLTDKLSSPIFGVCKAKSKTELVCLAPCKTADGCDEQASVCQAFDPRIPENGICAPKCSSDLSCPAGSYGCDKNTGLCLLPKTCANPESECSTEQKSEDGLELLGICKEKSPGLNVCLPYCKVDIGCNEQGSVCQPINPLVPETGICAPQCKEDSDCSAGSYGCDKSKGICLLPSLCQETGKVCETGQSKPDGSKLTGVCVDKAPGLKVCLASCDTAKGCDEKASVCQGLDSRLPNSGICAPECKSDKECPAGSYGCGKNGVCTLPAICQTDGASCETGLSNADGDKIIGICKEKEKGYLICLPPCEVSEGCDEAGAVCQPLNPMMPDSGICAPACTSDSACPAGSYGCGLDGTCNLPKICDKIDAPCSTSIADGSGSFLSGICKLSNGLKLCLPPCKTSGGCDEQNAVCQPISFIDADSGICTPACIDDSNCPAGSYGCKDGICLLPDLCSSPDTQCETSILDTNGKKLKGLCKTQAPGLNLCLQSCDTDIGCDENQSVCQPLNPTSPKSGICKASCSSDSECPASTYGCDTKKGICILPEICGTGPGCNYTGKNGTIQSGICIQNTCLAGCNEAKDCDEAGSVCQHLSPSGQNLKICFSACANDNECTSLSLGFKSCGTDGVCQF